MHKRAFNIKPHFEGILAEMERTDYIIILPEGSVASLRQ